MSEAQLPKSAGLQVIKFAAPESVKSPRTSPFVSADNNTATSLQTRTLGAPESLRPSHTLPSVSADSHVTSSPQTQRVAVPPESIKPTHALLFVSEDSHTTASPKSQHSQPDRELVTDNTANQHQHHNTVTVHSKPLSAGNGWLDDHSGTGSQVSIGSHSPKPHSVQHFVVDLEDSGGNSQSQRSEVDCSYIVPSNEVESVFIAPPPSSDFDNFSPNEESSAHHTLEELHSPKGERDEAEICETQFNSSVAPTTAILDTPSSAGSTPVRYGSQPPVAIEHFTAENGHEYALVNKSSPGQTRRDNETDNDGTQEEDECHSKKSKLAEQPGDLEQLPPIATRRLAFEKNIVQGGENSAPKPAKVPPAVPKRVSSISTLQKQTPSPVGDQNGTDTVTSSAKSPGPLEAHPQGQLQQENETEEEDMPPPPPMSTHPGLASKKTEPNNEQQHEENPKPDDVELREGSKFRPKPKERRKSSQVVEPKEIPEQQQYGTESHTDNTDNITVSVSEIPQTTEVTQAPALPQDKVTNSVPALPQGDEALDESEESRDKEVSNEEKLNATPSASVAMSSDQSSTVERADLDNFNPSKKSGAEVSTFKPTPKPRSTRRTSTDTESIPTITVSSLAEDTPTTATALPGSSVQIPSPAKREVLPRAQSMSVRPITGSASPRMRVRGEQNSQMPPGFVVYSRSQEAVVGHHHTMSSSMMRRTIQVGTEKKSGEDKTDSASAVAAPPMNTKRGIKKRRSFFRRK